MIQSRYSGASYSFEVGRLGSFQGRANGKGWGGWGGGGGKNWSEQVTRRFDERFYSKPNVIGYNTQVVTICFLVFLFFSFLFFFLSGELYYTKWNILHTQMTMCHRLIKIRLPITQSPLITTNNYPAQNYRKRTPSF